MEYNDKNIDIIEKEYETRINIIQKDYHNSYETPAKNIRYVLAASVVMSGVAFVNGNVPFTYLFIGTSALSLAKLIELDDKKITKYRDSNKEITEIQEKVKQLRKGKQF